MGAAFAESLGLIAGDTITLEINGEARDYEITGISQPSGLFTRE